MKGKTTTEDLVICIACMSVNRTVLYLQCQIATSTLNQHPVQHPVTNVAWHV